MSCNRKIVMLIIGVVFLGTLSGCSKVKQLKDTAIENIATESNLPQYNLDTKRYDSISYDDNRYLITDEKLDIDLIGEAIGKVSYSCTINENKNELSKEELRKLDVDGSKKQKERYKLTFGWIHEIKDEDSNEEIAVNINNLYYKCKLEKK